MPMISRPEAEIAATMEIESRIDLISKNLLLANAGGITATLLLVGPFLQQKVFTKWIGLPLGLFLAGSISVFLVWWSQVASGMYRVSTTHPILNLAFQRKPQFRFLGDSDLSISEGAEKLAGRKPIFLFAAAIFFLCGSISGCVVILTR